MTKKQRMSTVVEILVLIKILESYQVVLESYQVEKKNKDCSNMEERE